MKRALTLALIPLAACAAQQRRPNIVFVLSDDHACAALGAYGAAHAPTPHLDALARQGVIFDAACVANSICAPSRAAILSGRYGHVNGVLDNGGRLGDDVVTFPELLVAAGYRTALVGKWHLKRDPKGFERWEVLPGQGHYYGPKFRTPDGERIYEGYVSEIVTDFALRELEAATADERPFFLMVGHKAPHRSWMPGPDQHALFEGELIPEPATLFDDGAGRSAAFLSQEMTIARHMYLHYDLKVSRVHTDPPAVGPDRWEPGRFDRMTPDERATWYAAYDPRNQRFRQANLEGDELVRWKYQRYMADYLRCVAGVDESVGAIVAKLDELGLAEDTIVVYASDQGFFLGEHGFYDKRFMYEPALRFPLIVRWPGVTEAGRREERLAMNLDLGPTILDAADVATPADWHGASLAPLLAGDDAPGWRDSLYYQYFEEGIHAVNRHYGVRTGRHKLIHFPGLDAWEMYDLASDPDELRNLANESEHAELRAELAAELADLRERYDAPS